ncbi:MAG: hypothetical protein AAGL17_12710 [Cyanobacteria bacterium J06576_12]
MTLNSISDIAKSASYNRHKRTLAIQFLDGSILSIPVRLLEMISYNGSEWLSVEPSDEQIQAVEVSYHGDRIIWDDIGQRYRINDLKQGVYGRKAWMDSLRAAISA